MKHKRLYYIALAALLIVGAGGFSVFLGVFRASSLTPDVKTPLSAEQLHALVPRGQELARAADCFGCHSLPEGPMAAGGVAISTPFGTLHSTNITPDPTYGIGKYSRADFHRVMKYGIAPGHRNLYPAMPFLFTQVTTPDDIDALYAYLMTIPPIAVANKRNSAIFRLPVRPFVNFWALFNFPKREALYNDQRSADWNRGAYLVEGLAHCGGCHTPLNLMMAPDFARNLQGGILEGMVAPDITQPMLTRQGFDIRALSQYLKTGIAPQGTSFADMNTVTHFSTNVMADDDIRAIATYLLTDKDGNIPAAKSAPEALPQALQAAPGSEMDKGRMSYISACAGCHGLKGEGIPNVAPAMKGNGIVALDRPNALINTILNGIATQTFTDRQRMYAMPSFADTMDESEIAALVSWMRAQWGGQGGHPVTGGEVKAFRRSVR
jgi:mono/diheme cytochrome c family protein